MNVRVPSMEPGASSLPSELRIRRGNNQTVVGQDRLMYGQRFAQGLRGLGVCISGVDSDTGEDCTDSTGGITPITIPDPYAGTISSLPISSGTSDVVDLATLDTALQAANQNPTTPVTVTTQTVGGTTQTQTMTPAQLATLINQSVNGLTKVLAITQGGSVLANGSIIGSQAAAQVAASASTLTASGLTATLGSMLPLLLVGGIGLWVLSSAMGKR